MEFKSYIDLYELLRTDRTTPQERRAFGLVHESLSNDPAAQLSAWVNTHRDRLKYPRLSEQIDTLLYHATLILVLIAFVLGLFSGIALLSYNGKEPVNLIYFLAMVVFLPLVTMTLSLFAMLRANRARNLLVHISPAYWMERLVALFSQKSARDLSSLKINPLLLNWMVIKRSQLLALVFSIGLLLALLGVVATRDVAFAWSTTLDLSDTQFHTFVQTIAFPWRSWMPSAVPSLELIAQSHYFRLGGKLSETMVEHAALLGTWWKFLAMATLFYAVLLRTLFYIISVIGFKKALREAMLTLDGTKLLLKEMNEPLVTMQATEQEADFSQREAVYERIIHNKLDASYDAVQGWAIPKEMLMTLCDALSLISPRCHEVGGNNTLDKDKQIVAQSEGKVVLFVKAWEPPTMDFIDHLKMLAAKADKVIVVPVGTAKSGFAPSAKEIDVWVRKISGQQLGNVWVKV
jgi:hypothetical protein